MQYYIIKEKIADLASQQDIPLQEVIDRLDGTYAFRRNIVMEGGPTRSISIINSLCEILDCTCRAFSLKKAEPWDVEQDEEAFMDHFDDPLDTDITHFSSKI